MVNITNDESLEDGLKRLQEISKRLDEGRDRLIKWLECYQKAINEIDDYFEYSHHSSVDKVKVMCIIDRLNKDIINSSLEKEET